jgi:hypothetical protein
MKIECGQRKLSDGTMMYVDMRGRHIHFGGTECEPPWKIVFQPEKRGPSIDYEHKEFVKCLNWSKAQGYLNDTELVRRIRRGRPVTVSTTPIKPVEKKKITKATGNIDEIMANIKKLHKKQIALEDEIIAEDIPSKADESDAAYFQKIKNDTEYIEDYLQKEDAAYVKSVSETVYQSVGLCQVV